MKYFKYFKYMLRHKWFVMLTCFKQGLYWQGLTHDNSKFLLDEFVPYARHFYGGNNEKKYKAIAQTKSGYLKSNDKGDILFDFAWLLHIHRNPHHWQYWILIQDEDANKALEMMPKYRKEMLCDWQGAAKAQGRIHPNELQDWYKAHKGKMQLNKLTKLETEASIKLLRRING